MLSSNKITIFILAFYLTFAIIPGLVADFVMVTPDPVQSAVISCILFVLGFLITAFFLPIKQKFMEVPLEGSIIKGFKSIVVILFLLTIYILVAGPKPPIFGLVTSSDPLLAMQLREDALKLNQDLIFVRLYSWARDIFAPIAFILALGLVHSPKKILNRIWILAGIGLSLFIGLWSGQKATIINYLFASLIFLSANLGHLFKKVLRTLPIAVGLIVIIFIFTSAKLLSVDRHDMLVVLGDIWTGIVYRIFVAPMEVAAAYIDAVDNLKIIGPIDVIFPLINTILTPDLPSAENRISIEYFYREGLESGFANAPAFAYAYVVGGQVASFIGGGLVFATLWLAMNIVRSTRSTLVIIIFETYLAYLIMDLVTSNFIHYSFKILMSSLFVLLFTSIFRKTHPLKSRTDYPKATHHA